MASNNYSACLAKVFEYEGGFVNHPSDPGGATNHGITIATARKYWKANATVADVKAMPKSVAADIYRKAYWNAVAGDSLPAGPDLCTFDSAVNSGVGRADKWLSYGVQVPAGKTYAQLATLAQSAPDKAAVVKRMCAKRLSFLQNLKTWGTFGKGWARRVASVQALGVKMALQATGKTPQQVNDALATEAAKTTDKRTTDLQKAGTGVALDGAAQSGWWEWDFLHIGLVALLVVLLFWGYNRYRTHTAVIEAYKEVINEPTASDVTSDEPVQVPAGATPVQGVVLRDDLGQDDSPVHPQE